MSTVSRWRYVLRDDDQAQRAVRMAGVALLGGAAAAAGQVWGLVLGLAVAWLARTPHLRRAFPPLPPETLDRLRRGDQKEGPPWPTS